MPTIHAITINNGDVNLAGRDVHVHKHYHSYSDKVDITAVLGTICNLRKIHLDVLSKATPGTGVWLLKTHKFRIWLDPDGNLKVLWGTGIPGAGKTVLVSIVIRELEARASAEGRQICICYVYIRYSDRADLTVCNVLEILVKQTVERHPNCALLAEQAYAQHVREGTLPTEAELLQLLHQFTEATEATFYFLDALDEAPDRVQVDLMLKLASLNVRLFITSRPLKAVEARAPNAHCFTIVAQEGDLDLHIAQEIARSRDLQGLLEREGSSLRNEIVTLVKSKCDGMFLHASLQLEAVCECVTAHEIRATLEAFPARIEDVYRQTWHRIMGQKPSQVLLAKAALVWVLNASRSMMIEELERAVATAPDTYKFESDRRAPGTTLIALCRGLVTLEEESRLIRLVHYTAKDTLQGLLRDSFPHPHSHLVMICITHLTERGFQNTTIRSEKRFIAARHADPLLAYASDAWSIHARNSLDVEDTRLQIANFVRECNSFPAFTSPNLLNDFDILSPLHILAGYDLPITLLANDDVGDPNAVTRISQDSPLVLACWHGHAGPVASLLDHPKIQVNRVNNNGWSAIMLAAFNGHKSTIELLLAHSKTRVNRLSNWGLSALMLAASKGHDRIVRLLLAHPKIQVNLVDKKGWSALIHATLQGQEQVVKLLLEHPEIQVNLVNDEEWSALSLAAGRGDAGLVASLVTHPKINVISVDNQGWTSLMRAASRGHEGCVNLLLAHVKIQINTVNKKGWSALMLATRYGHQSTVKLLLAHPEIDVNLINTRGWSALIKAVRFGCVATVKLLLARPEIQVNLVDHEGWSALMLAACNGHEGIVAVLLVHPEIQVNLVSNKGWSALRLAAGHRHLGAVKALLAHPEIQANLVDRRGWSALMKAASIGDKGVIKALLAHPDIQVNLADVDGWPALTVAVSCGCKSIVKLLLAHTEIQVDLVDKDGWSALIYASSYGYKDLLAPLLSHPDTSVNLADNQGWSPLMHAASFNHKGAVTFLIANAKIEVNDVCKDGWSPLMKAASKGHAGIVKLVLAHPSIQVNLVDNGGWSALMWAAYNGHKSTVEILLDHPDIDVNLTDNEGWSTLMMAADAGHEGIVLLLLDVPHVNTTSTTTKGRHSAMSVALAKGHGGVVCLLQELQYRR